MAQFESICHKRLQITNFAWNNIIRTATMVFAWSHQFLSLFQKKISFFSQKRVMFPKEGWIILHKKGMDNIIIC
jgi:hypothetical protein